MIAISSSVRVSITEITSAASGTVRGWKRATTSPLRPITNFSKFQVISPGPLGLASNAFKCL